MDKKGIKYINIISIVLWAAVPVIMIGLIIYVGYQLYVMPAELSQSPADITNGELIKVLLVSIAGMAMFSVLHVIEKYALYRLRYSQA